jgi:hypothetical protein
MVVAPAEPPAENHDFEVIQGHAFVDQPVDMNPVRMGTGQLAGICAFVIAI